MSEPPERERSGNTAVALLTAVFGDVPRPRPRRGRPSPGALVLRTGAWTARVGRPPVGAPAQPALPLTTRQGGTHGSHP
ncbi:hypothetical protein AB0I00_02730 [Streptomyces sp. NPDC050803]|uniref:hypothetical protein n=1 Tax=unclassified Streptomyces TaxID=2593676 RepID=UPI00342308F3